MCKSELLRRINIHASTHALHAKQCYKCEKKTWKGESTKNRLKRGPWSVDRSERTYNI